MTTDIPACPQCDSSRVYPRNAKHGGTPGWSCEHCGHISSPVYRQPIQERGPGSHTLAGRLLEMDPAEVGDE
jgi:ribosomal protein L37AE/L43A